VKNIALTADEQMHQINAAVAKLSTPEKIDDVAETKVVETKPSTPSA
jgi:hypothetical protein